MILRVDGHIVIYLPGDIFEALEESLPMQQRFCLRAIARPNVLLPVRGYDITEWPVLVAV